MIDPLIKTLMDRIPEPETMWPMTQRALWLNAMAHAFCMIYRSENAFIDGVPTIKAIVLVDVAPIGSQTSDNSTGSIAPNSEGGT